MMVMTVGQMAMTAGPVAMTAGPVAMMAGLVAMVQMTDREGHPVGTMQATGRPASELIESRVNRPLSLVSLESKEQAKRIPVEQP